MNEKRVKAIPDYKKNAVANMANKIKENKTFLIVSIKGLPDSQFQKIKKKLRGKAEVKVAKKSIVLRAIKASEKGALQNIKEKISADVAILFSNTDAFELSGFLSDNQTSTKAKAGDLAPEDIEIEAGPTELIPGPAISELGSVGLQVAVEDGKLAIKKNATVVKEGGEIDEKLASVLAKLNVEPMKVGLEPVAAYDSDEDKVYLNIKIDKEGTYESLKEAIAKSLNFAVNIGLVNDKTVGYFIAKAGMEEKALEGLVGKGEEKPAEEVKEEKKEEAADEEKKESSEEKKEEPKEEPSEEVKTEEKVEEKKEEANDQSEKEESN